MLYQKLIDEKGIASLKKLINTNLNSIYSEALEVYKNFIQSRLFILRTGDSTWLNLSNECLESPDDNDYYELIINESEYPEKISYHKENNTFTHPFSKIIFNRIDTKIKLIEIYSRRETHDNEDLYYDVLLLFSCNNEFKFIICIEERVDEIMTYSSEESIISKYINNGLELRKSI